MTTPPAPAEILKPKVTDLAAGIFTRLVGDSAKVSDKGLSFATDPTVLAQLSFKLAKAFQKVEDDINADALPKNVGYKLDSADISGWTPK